MELSELIERLQFIAATRRDNLPVAIKVVKPATYGTRPEPEWKEHFAVEVCNIGIGRTVVEIKF